MTQCVYDGVRGNMKFFSKLRKFKKLCLKKLLAGNVGESIIGTLMVHFCNDQDIAEF